MLFFEVFLPLCYQRQRQNVAERWFYAQHSTEYVRMKRTCEFYTRHTETRLQQYFCKLHERVIWHKKTSDVNPPPPQKIKKNPHYLFQRQEDVGWTVSCMEKTRACSVCTGQQQLAADGSDSDRNPHFSFHLILASSDSHVSLFAC